MYMENTFNSYNNIGQVLVFSRPNVFKILIRQYFLIKFAMNVGFHNFTVLHLQHPFYFLFKVNSCFTSEFEKMIMIIWSTLIIGSDGWVSFDCSSIDLTATYMYI